MTAISTKAPNPSDKTSRQNDVQPPRKSFPPSATEEEAKTRFSSALTEGVDTLLERGHGRERASAELLNEIADGCSPDEDEIFQTMKSLGISLEDAAKVITVSSAFRKARTTKSGSSAAAIDELTTRLNLADLSHRGRSPSPAPSAAASIPPTPLNLKMSELTRNESVDSFQTRPNGAKKGQRPVRATKAHREGRGRKRALAEKAPGDSQANVMLEEPKGKVAAATDLEVKEKMLNAKLSKAEGKKPKSSCRAKSPEGLGAARGKRPAAAVLEESQAAKRPRTRSQTEESIPPI
eukprot:CAMPEP_0172527094 /NCGR_PEP_ID=MMETSP1067-20121228/1862_1 /TAXON_ID=265564 ORGANISM="Thalassiosira punctigera, Strain Tpunct2005C2" /NCGR_SAMPLE_ID=MMETSP1067 /ASSEMBLY_ACC=CAM_ASM_000444 /LENGTH=293 /DNA_ID=CAMNT_0013310759 /DNA_START=84 /DNA_END=965 /DNA_ORIENTATION=+